MRVILWRRRLKFHIWQVLHFVRIELIELSSHPLAEQDLLKDVLDLFHSLLIAKHFPLVDSEKQFDIQAVNILIEILAHAILSFTKCQESQVRVLALELAPVCISVTA